MGVTKMIASQYRIYVLKTKEYMTLDSNTSNNMHIIRKRLLTFRIGNGILSSQRCQQNAPTNLN